MEESDRYPYDIDGGVGCGSRGFGSPDDLSRQAVGPQEDDQIFINASEQNRYLEQQAAHYRISRLTKPIIALAVASGALLARLPGHLDLSRLEGTSKAGPGRGDGRAAVRGWCVHDRGMDSGRFTQRPSYFSQRVVVVRENWTTLAIRHRRVDELVG